MCCNLKKTKMPNISVYQHNKCRVVWCKIIYSCILNPFNETNNLWLVVFVLMPLCWIIFPRHTPADAHCRSQRRSSPTAALRLRLPHGDWLRPTRTARLRLRHVKPSCPQLSIHLSLSCLLDYCGLLTRLYKEKQKKVMRFKLFSLMLRRTFICVVKENNRTTFLLFHIPYLMLFKATYITIFLF